MTELTLTLKWLGDATAGRVTTGTLAAVLGDVVIDSRMVGPGDVFVALRGDRHDGHEFVPAVCAAGAGAVVVDQEWFAGHAQDVADTGPATGVVVVNNTLVALQDMARVLRQASTTKVVAITGSAGKTTTKEAVAAMLAAKVRVVKNVGNLNNHIGLPLSLMQLRQCPDVAVMELGMNHRGEIRALVDIADPDVRVWTNVGDAHLGFFASPDDIADAKAEILEGAEAADLLVYNADDSRISARIGAFPGRVSSFGFSPRAVVRAVDVEDLGLSGMKARLLTPAGEHSLRTPLLGRGNLANLLAAAAVALQFDVPLDMAVDQGERLRPTDRRGVVRVRRGITVVDDSYNSSPSALLGALDVLASESGRYHRIAVLGEMLELGEHAEALHRQCGAAAARTGLEMLVTVGGAAAQAMAKGAIDEGMPPDAVRYFETSPEAATFVERVTGPGSLVLVKGSRGVRTDRVVERLIGEVG